jgi:predicted glycosyltransferase
LRVWVDIDNPPQTRYLLPLARRFEQAGHEVTITARAYGDTLAMLDTEGVVYEAIGSSFGRGLPRKLVGLAARARQLTDFVRRQPQRPGLVLAGSRSSGLAARRLGIPSFVILDYEYSDLLVFLLSGTNVIFPSVIDAAHFRRRGISAGRLIPFDGLKEDLSFADIDFDSVPEQDFGQKNGAPRFLFRPPAEESHYYRRESKDLALELLHYLAGKGAKVVFSPRFDWQVGYLESVSHWPEDPVVLERPIPFVSLLKGVDAVVSAGGTMLREAAYLGVPAYSIFRSRIGAVDRHLESVGRLSLLGSAADFPRIELSARGSLRPLRAESRVADDVSRVIIERALASGCRGESGPLSSLRS